MIRRHYIYTPIHLYVHGRESKSGGVHERAVMYSERRLSWAVYIESGRGVRGGGGGRTAPEVYRVGEAVRSRAGAPCRPGT